MKNEVATYK